MEFHETNLAKIRFDYLNTFKVLVQKENFSETAKYLNKTQGTISQHLKELEDCFNATLIERTSKKFEITDAGKELLFLIEDLFSRLEQTKIKINELEGIQNIKIEISASSIPGEYLLPQLFMKFRQENPNFEIVLNISNSFDALDQLTRGKVNFCAIGSSISQNPNLFDSIEIGEDHIVIVARKTHPILKFLHSKSKISQEDLDNKLLEYPWVFREEGSATREWFLQKFPLAKKIKIGLEFHNNISIINALENSNALSAISDKILEGENFANHIRILSNPLIPEISRKFYFLKIREHLLNKNEIIFWDAIQKINRSD